MGTHRIADAPPREQGTAPSSRAGSGPARWIRILLPALLIVGWLVAGSVGGPYFGKVDEVSSNDQTTYLPSSAEATQVQQMLPGFNEQDRIPAIVLFSSDTALGQDQTREITAALKALKGREGVAGDISPAIPSEDGKAVQAFVSIDSSAEVGAVVEDLRQDLRQTVPSGVTVQVTGPAGFTADLLEGFSGIDGLLLAVSLVAVLIILVVVYRSFLLPLAVLLSSVFALCVALLTVWWLAKAGVLDDDTAKKVREDARQAAIAALRKALADPMPDPSNIEEGVYAD